MFGWFFFLFVSPMNRNAPLSRFTASVQKLRIETAEHFILWFCETLFEHQKNIRIKTVLPMPHPLGEVALRSNDGEGQ